jgi:hypothetical protein
MSELRQTVEEAFADSTPSAPARDVFSRLREHHAVASKKTSEQARVA